MTRVRVGPRLCDLGQRCMRLKNKKRKIKLRVKTFQYLYNIFPSADLRR